MLPNDPDVHLCANCGAPMTSYAAIGPFEHLLAEGHVYRQATEGPRKLIVVLGVWFIFGLMALSGVALLLIGRETRIKYVIVGAFILPISVVVIWRTTWSYRTRTRTVESRDA